MNLLIVGCGKLGKALLRAALPHAMQLSAWVSTPSSQQEVMQQGVECRLLDLDEAPQQAFATEYGIDIDTFSLIYMVPPPRHGVSDSRMQNFIRGMADSRPERIVLISTTGVYGDCDGEWVDETRPVNPGVDRAKRRLSAETQLLEWCEDRSVPYLILRVPGIYGPARLPFARLRAGKPLLREDQSPYSNRIHEDDLVSVCLAALTSHSSNLVLNVADDNPSTMTDYFCQIARVFDLPQPEQIDMQQAHESMSQEMLGYLSESRRISNQQMKQVLGITLQYPDIQKGLAACKQVLQQSDSDK